MPHGHEPGCWGTSRAHGCTEAPARCTSRLPSLSGKQVVGQFGALQFGACCWVAGPCLAPFGLRPLGLGSLSATLARGLLPGHCLAPCDLRSLGLGGLPVTRPSHLYPGTCYRRGAAAPGEERTPLFSFVLVRSCLDCLPLALRGFWVFDLSCCG